MKIFIRDFKYNKKYPERKDDINYYIYTDVFNKYSHLGDFKKDFKPKLLKFFLK